MIRAYPRDVTVSAGGTLVLHVATDAPHFRVRFFRAGARDEAGDVARQEWHSGIDCPGAVCDTPWAWPAYEFPIPAQWRGGAYVAVFETASEPHDGATLDARSGAALFVIRTTRIAPIAMNLPLFTYHAYNTANVDGSAGSPQGECLYTGPRAVTLHRPGGGTGGHLWDEVHRDAYDPSTPRQTFAHWDARALAWLERAGYAVDVVTDLDLHRGDALHGRRLLLAFGHQEYWTREMRAALERHAAGGGNVAFFSGNTAYFRVCYDAGRRAIVRDGKWSDDAPEEQFTGTSYRFGAGRWRGERPATGYTVVSGAHWAFAGTGLGRGDRFGAAERLAGYECDGRAPGGAAALLAEAPLTGWTTDDNGEVFGRAAAMTLLPLGRGLIFNAGTVDWPRLLGAGHDTVERITRNVIDRLAR